MKLLPSHLRLLDTITSLSGEGVTRREIAAITGHTPTWISRAVTALLDAGLVTVEGSSDRRNSTVRLTEAGRAAWEEIARDTIVCPVCKGRKRAIHMPDNPCQACRGEGRVPKVLTEDDDAQRDLLTLVERLARIVQSLAVDTPLHDQAFDVVADIEAIRTPTQTE